MAEMGLGDIQQKLEASILMYNKKPVLFMKVSGDLKTCRVYNLMAQKEEVVEFNEKLFTPPIPRIGMVNIGGGAFYVKRIPIRRYKLGYSQENLKVVELPADYPDRLDKYKAELKGLRSKELAQAMLKKYPTLKAAFKQLEQFDGIVAFDKQFAITHDNKLIYKDTVVGTHDFKKIKLAKGFEHLAQLVTV